MSPKTDMGLSAKLETPSRARFLRIFTNQAGGIRALLMSARPCRYVLPLAELGGDFYDELKSRSSGYASFDYEESGER